MSETSGEMTTILVIDDDDDLASVFCDALVTNGFSTLKATTGQAGIQLAQLHHPQLIICDIGLTDISGYSVLESVRSHLPTKAIPIVILTGHDVSDTFRRSMEQGADDYLPKPINLDTFLRAVETQLTKREQLSQCIASKLSDSTSLFSVFSNNLNRLEEQFKTLKQAPWSSLWVIQLHNSRSLQARYGHVFGQLVLQAIGQQLRQWREHWHHQDVSINTLGYSGTDRFAVFLRAPCQISNTLCETAIANLKAELQQPMVVNNHRLIPDIRIEFISGSKLAALETLEAVLSTSAPVVQAPLAERLRRAIQQDKLQLYFQPQVDLNSGQIIGAEALVRWVIPGESPLLPGQFIPVAEENGLMLPLGEWILEAALQQLYHWQKKQLSGISIAVNLSGYQLRSPHFINRLMAMVNNTKVSPVMMDLELPESLIMKDLSQAKLLLTELQNQGFSTAIDDFGSGCLSHLQYLPVNILKLDKCFVRDLHQNRSNQVIVRAIMEMARGLNISTIANGVETARELSILKQIKCQSMQGYLFSPALTAQDFEMLLLESSKRYPKPPVESSHATVLQGAV
ncbi:MAG: EAL domain-containing protein [Cyanobacteria bacterium P01_B01_bin.77]